MVASAEEFVVVVSQGVGVTPVLVLHALEVSLRLTVVSILRVGYGVSSPHLVGVVVLPSVAELRAERQALKGFPVQRHVVVLLETLPVLVRIHDAFHRVAARVRAAFLVAFVARR